MAVSGPAGPAGWQATRSGRAGSGGRGSGGRGSGGDVASEVPFITKPPSVSRPFTILGGSDTGGGVTTRAGGVPQAEGANGIPHSASDGSGSSTRAGKRPSDGAPVQAPPPKRSQHGPPPGSPLRIPAAGSGAPQGIDGGEADMVRVR